LFLQERILSAAMTSPSTLKSDATTISTVGIAHGTSHFFHLLLAAPLFPFLAVEFKVSNVQLGLLMTVFFTVSAIGQAMAGFVVDRFGARRVLYVGLSLFIAAAWLGALAPQFAWLYACAALAGAGNSVFHPVDFSILNARVSKPRLGHAFSVHGITGNLGWAASAVVLAGVAAMSSWRVALVVAGVIALATLVLVWALRAQLDDSAIRTARAADNMAQTAAPSSLAFLRNPAVWMCWMFFLLTTLALGAIQSFGPTVASTQYGFDKETAATILSLYTFMGALGMVLGGWVVVRFTRYDGIIATSMGLAVVAALLIAASALPGAGMLVLLAVMGFSVGVANPSRDLMIRQAATRGAMGRVYGVVYSGLDVGFMVAPVVTGWLVDQGHVRSVFVFIAAALALAIVFAWRVSERSVQPIAAAAE
jgi:MFS transporter, FSR family, fosmidomycin resistance protein